MRCWATEVMCCRGVFWRTMDVMLSYISMAIAFLASGEVVTAPPPPTKTVMVLRAQVVIPESWRRSKGVGEDGGQARWGWGGMGSFVLTKSSVTNLRTFVERLKRGFTQKGYQLVTERRTTLDGQPAVALDVTISRKAGDVTVEVQQRIYCVNTKGRFYTLIFAAEKKRWSDVGVRRVARSFQAL